MWGDFSCVNSKFPSPLEALQSYSLQKYLLKMRGYNVFLDQNTKIHYKYLNSNLHNFAEFLDQWIFRLFCRGPQIFTFAAGKCFALYISE